MDFGIHLGLVSPIQAPLGPEVVARQLHLGFHPGSFWSPFPNICDKKHGIILQVVSETPSERLGDMDQELTKSEVLGCPGCSQNIVNTVRIGVLHVFFLETFPRPPPA